jgi:hypothetical protein
MFFRNLSKNLPVQSVPFRKLLNRCSWNLTLRSFTRIVVWTKSDNNNGHITRRLSLLLSAFPTCVATYLWERKKFRNKVVGEIDTTFVSELFLRAWAKSRKAPYSFIMSVRLCPFINSAPTGRILMKRLLKYVEKIKVCLKSDKISDTLHENLSKFYIVDSNVCTVLNNTKLFLCFHGNSRYPKAPQCYVTRTLLLCFRSVTIFEIIKQTWENAPEFLKLCILFLIS